MSSMNIFLPEEIKAFVESKIAKEGYDSASDYLRSLILEDQKRSARRELEAKLLEGMQGPSVVMTPEDWQSMEREAIEGLSGESIRP